jgi:glycosyltransferase involved in cell wall biosynthesis
MRRPIRVLQLLVSTSPGGGPKHVHDLVRHLPKTDFEFMVGAPRDGIFFKRFQELGIPAVEIPFGRVGIGPLLATIGLIRRVRADLVHTHGKGAGLHGRLAARLLGVPAVHTFHGIHYRSYPAIGQRFYLALERRLSRLSRTIINVSGSQEAEGLSLHLFRPEQSQVILNGVDFEEMDRTLLDNPIKREDLGLGRGDFVLGCISRVDPVKRLEVLLDALARLRDRIPGVTLILVGGGGEEDRLRHLTRRLALQDRVVFTGFLERPARIYSAVDLYVSSSLKEGLPLAMVEAMGAGLATVATDVPGHRDVVVHGKTGLLVPADDAVNLAEAVAWLWADPVKRAALGHDARRRAREEFGIEKMLDRTAAVYRAAGPFGDSGLTEGVVIDKRRWRV